MRHHARHHNHVPSHPARQLLIRACRYHDRLGASLCWAQEPQREQLQALLDNIYGDFVSTVAKSRSKTEAEVKAMLDDGIYGERLFVLACTKTSGTQCDHAYAQLGGRNVRIDMLSCSLVDCASWAAYA